ncbi:MAG: M20/M25/M40 family metallo-hydrolase, partial [Nocardioidaceae bacterium]
MDTRERIHELMPQARDELAELVAIPSISDTRQYPPEDCDRAAEWVRSHFAALGFDAHLEPTPDGSKAVVGSRSCADPHAPTVLLYAHYDVQPPLDDAAWHTPPFELTRTDGRWYGRGTADCKGNIVMHLAALRALPDDLPVHLKLVVEGSEEQGTGGLESFVPGHAPQLRAATILVFDTRNAALGRPAPPLTQPALVNPVVSVR